MSLVLPLSSLLLYIRCIPITYHPCVLLALFIGPSLQTLDERPCNVWICRLKPATQFLSFFLLLFVYTRRPNLFADSDTPPYQLSNAAQSKIDAVRSYGAKTTDCEPTAPALLRWNKCSGALVQHLSRLRRSKHDIGLGHRVPRTHRAGARSADPRAVTAGAISFCTVQNQIFGFAKHAKLNPN